MKNNNFFNELYDELYKLIIDDDEIIFSSKIKSLDNDSAYLLICSLMNIDNYKYFELTLNNYKLNSDSYFALIFNCKNITYFPALFNKYKYELTDDDIDSLLFYASVDNILDISLFLVENGADIFYANCLKDEIKEILRVKKLKQIL